MHPLAAEKILESVRLRERQGDYPTEVAYSRETLEGCLIEIAQQRDRLRVPPSAPDTKPDEQSVTDEMLCAAVDAFNEWPAGLAARAWIPGITVLDTRTRAMRRAIEAAFSKMPRASSPPEGEDTQRLPTPKPWESITEAERHEWAPRGPYRFVPDGAPDDDRWYTINGPGHPADTFPYTTEGALQASRYVAWKNRDSARAAIPPQEKR